MRPKKLLDPSVGDAAIAARREGKSIAQAAKAAGVSSMAMTKWLRFGREGMSVYAEFARAFDEAYAAWIKDRALQRRPRVAPEHLSGDLLARHYYEHLGGKS